MSTRRFLLMGSAVLLFASCGTYFGAFFNELVQYDDNVYVIFNSHTAGGLSPSGFHYAWTTFDSGNWIPLTWLSYQLDATLFGMRPMGFHATNVALHTANVLLLFAWLVNATASRWRSAAVAILFAVHPLHVESVAWVAERKDVLSTFWMLVSLHAYTTYAMRPRLKWYVVTFVTFALALLSKSMVVTLPVLFLFVDCWPLQRWKRMVATETPAKCPTQTANWLIVEKIPLFALSFLDGIMTIFAATSSKSFAKVTLLNRLGNCLQSYGWYVAKTIVPTELCVLYPHPIDHVDGIQVGLFGALFVGISLYVGLQGYRRPAVLFGWLWFVISLLPVIGLLQVGSQSHADRYSYIPQIGLLVLILWECQSGIVRFPSARKCAIVGVAVTTVTFAYLAAQQVAVWKTTETLWKHAITIDPDNWYAHGALANLCLESDRFDEATRHFEVVAKYHPEDKESNRKLIEVYRRYPGKARNTWRFYNELGRYHAEEKNMSVAAVAFAAAVSLAPDNVNVRNNLGVALSQRGRDPEAEEQFKKVLSQNPNDVNAHVNLGVLLQKANKLKEAREHFIAAIRISPQDQEAHQRLQAVEKSLRLQ